MKKLFLSITAVFLLITSCEKENNLLNIPTNQDIQSLKSTDETNTEEFLSSSRTRNLCNAGFVLQVAPPNRVLVTSPLTDTTINHHWNMGDTSSIRTTRIVRHMYRPGTFTITHIITRPSLTPTGPSCTDTARFTIHVPITRSRRIIVR
jgi:hypothetical protein